ncbi:MAG: DNA recombination/repair protein RecA, partial [Gammaproteobacteria bacterium]|nr:DNA recombination/repair protein RecA [Gammaproteobacteria bacterium]
KIGQGKDNARQFLKDHPEMASEIEGLIRDKMLSQFGVNKSKGKNMQDLQEAEEPEFMNEE